MLNARNVSIASALLTALLIVLPGIILQAYIEKRISAYHERLNILELQRSEYVQLAAVQLNHIHSLELSGLIGQIAPKGKKLEVNEDPIALAEDPEIAELFDKLKRKEISPEMYLNRMGNYHRRKFQAFKSQTKRVGNEIASLQTNPPRAIEVKGFLHLLQYVGALFIALLNAKFLFQGEMTTIG